VPTFPWVVAAKALLYAAVLTAIGTCAVQSVLLPLVSPLGDGLEAVARGVASVRTRSAVAVLVALGLRALVETADVFGWPAVLSWDSVELVTIESRWGSAWHLQLAAAIIFLAVSAWAGRRHLTPGRREAVAVALAAILLAYSMPLLGHGAAGRWHMALHGTHVLAAGTWAGALMALALIPMPLADRLTLLRGLSPLALWGASVLGLSGLAMAWLYLGALSDLWTTTYGQVLSLKLAMVAGVAACGFVNWRRFAAERRGGIQGDRLGAVVVEVVLVAAVVLVTAGLTEIGHP
jgi:putative copper resistance protein D